MYYFYFPVVANVPIYNNTMSVIIHATASVNWLENINRLKVNNVFVTI